MSKTIDELVEIFNREAKLPSIRKADIAGIRAVVTALRDEMRREWFLDDSGLEAVERWMNEILASDGEVKAAGDVYPDGARISGLETTAPAASGSPAAAAPTVGQRLIKAAHEAAAIARGEKEPADAHHERMQRILDDQLKNQPLPPATDPAPAVCEYRNAFVAHENRNWRRRKCDGEVVYREAPGHCLYCGLPIKFTEAKT